MTHTQGRGRGRINRGRGTTRVSLSRDNAINANWNTARAKKAVISCYVCNKNHRVVDNPECNLKWMVHKRNVKDQATSLGGGSSRASLYSSNMERNGQSTGFSYWSDPPKDETKQVTFNAITLNSLLSNGMVKTIDAVVDGGATGTVIGINEYIQLCEELNLKTRIEKVREDDPQWHAFGLQGNSSRSEPVIGRAIIPIPCGNGCFRSCDTLVVDGAVPFVISKPTLREWKAVESHYGDLLEIEYGPERVKLSTYVGVDGHARLPLNHESMAMNVAQSFITTLATELGQCSVSDGKRLIDSIHARTHIHPTSLKVLLQRNGKWLPELWNYAHSVLDNCDICIRAGDPRPSRKVSFTKLHSAFNDVVFIDIMYWTDVTMQHKILNCVDLATSYTRLAELEDRSVQHGD